MSPELEEIVDALYRDSSERVRSIIKENISIAISEGMEARRLSKMLLPNTDAIQAIPSPVEPLSAEQLEEVAIIAKNNSWADRPRSYDGTSVDWIETHYQNYIPGLLKNDLRSMDRRLYDAFMKQVKRVGLPSNLNIPSRSENERRKKLLEAENPKVALQIDMIGREWRTSKSKNAYHLRSVTEPSETRVAAE